jgi:SulP family sulfate permease
MMVLITMGALKVALDLPVETIGSKFGGIPQSLPAFVLPDFTWEGVRHLFIPTLTIALLGAVESLLCARVADNLTDFRRHDPNQELMAQGVANMITPFFGGIPATGTIARTVTNVRAGARTPVAGLVHSAALLLIVLVAAPLASSVPLAVLSGILLYTAWNMGEWHEFAKLKQYNYTYRIILLGTFFLTVVFDLTVAVEVGLVMACVFFIYRMSTLFRIEALSAPSADDPFPLVPAQIAVYRLYGALFFGAVGKVEDLPDQLPADVRVVVLEVQRLISVDTSGLDALIQLQRTLGRRDIHLVLCEINEQPWSLLRRTHRDETLGRDNLVKGLPEALARALRLMDRPVITRAT